MSCVSTSHASNEAPVDGGVAVDGNGGGVSVDGSDSGVSVDGSDGGVSVDGSGGGVAVDGSDGGVPVCSILLFIINYSLSTWFSGHAQQDHMGFSFCKMVALIFDL